jgi:hypothetical protein
VFDRGILCLLSLTWRLRVVITRPAHLPHMFGGLADLAAAAAVSGPDDELADRLEGAATGSAGRHPAASRALERAAELTGDPHRAAVRLIAAARHAWHGGEPHRART